MKTKPTAKKSARKPRVVAQLKPVPAPVSVIQDEKMTVKISAHHAEFFDEQGKFLSRKINGAPGSDAAAALADSIDALKELYVVTVENV